MKYYITKCMDICGNQLEFWGNLLDTKWKLEENKQTMIKMFSQEGRKTTPN